jgi:NAD(P) transhydrogenase subunit alpha
MTQVAVPRETHPGENRVAATPETVKRLTRLGAEVLIEAGAGAASGYDDAEYARAGAHLSTDRKALLEGADLVLRVRKPTLEEVGLLKAGSVHISFLDPFNETALIGALRDRGVTALSMEMIPRTTLSQRMDALSSQANLAGYVMVILAAMHLPRIFPMLMTPAGTLKPAKVFVIGAGVAGLQAIATAKRLGARVTAFDTRPVVAEQVRSVGAKFLQIDLGETGQTKDGYAKELTEEQIHMQRAAQKSVIAESDVVITTAQVFGRKPPVIVTRDMVEGMTAGSVVVDMAAEQGGNVEGSKPGEIVEVGGVKIIGLGNLPNFVCRDATQMYSNNILSLVEHAWSEETKRFVVSFDGDILPGCVITHDWQVVNDTIRKIVEKAH